MKHLLEVLVLIRRQYTYLMWQYYQVAENLLYFHLLMGSKEDNRKESSALEFLLKP